MNRQGRAIAVGVLIGLIFVGAVRGQEEPRRGEIRGAFVRLTELRVGERGHLGIVVKPIDRDDHLTLVVPRQNEDLTFAARRLREGQRLEAVYVGEEGHMWLTRLSAERLEGDRREPGEARGSGEVQELRARVERLERSLDELRAELRRLRAQLQEQPGVRREVRREVRRDGDVERAEGDRPRSEREVVLHQIEVMRLALPALREAERGDAVDQLMQAIRARELTLEGRRDEEARRIRERAPNSARLAEILSLAARLWGQFGNADKAAAVRGLAAQLAARSPQDVRERREQPEPQRRAVHVTVQATDAGEPAVFFRERRVTMERLRELLRDLDAPQEQALMVHVRGDVREDFFRRIADAAREAGIRRIEVEHIQMRRDD